MNEMGGGNPNSLIGSILYLFTLYISEETINLYRRVTNIITEYAMCSEL